MSDDWGEWEWRRCDHRQKFYRTKSTTWTDENGWQHGIAHPFCDTCGSFDIRNPVTVHFKMLDEPVLIRP